MAEKLTVQYDREGDVLHLDAITPYAEQETIITDDWIVVRTNPRTGRVENVEIPGFSKKVGRLDQEISLPLRAEFSPLIEAEHRSKAAS